MEIREKIYPRDTESVAPFLSEDDTADSERLAELSAVARLFCRKV